MTATPRPTPDGMVSTAVKLTSPRKAIASGIAYLPEGRAANALFPMMTVAQNVTLPRLSKFIGLGGLINNPMESAAMMTVAQNVTLPRLSKFIGLGGLINNPMESAAVSALLKRLDLRPLKGAAKAKIRTFSGGNQQKAIIARWLLGSADIFLFDGRMWSQNYPEDWSSRRRPRYQIRTALFGS